MQVTLNKQDVKDDIAAALSLVLAIDVGVQVCCEPNCPYHTRLIAAKALKGLVKLLERMQTHDPTH